MENKVSGGFPRVLVVGGEPFNSRSATGITISNLFREWPTECIGQIYTANIEPDLSICSQNFRLSSKDLLPGWFRKLIDRKSLRRTVASSGKNIAGDNGGLTGKDVSGILGSRYLKLMAEFFSYRLPPDVLAFVSEFRPDVIYTTLGNIRIGRLAAYLSHRYSAPVVVHFMDDWLSTYSEHGRNVLTLLHRYVSANIANRLVLDAGVGMSIGELMAEEYTKKFSVPFHPFMNPVDIKKAVYPDVCDGQISESRSLFKLVYVGGLHLGRVEGVRELGKAVSIVRSKNIPVELNLYVPKSDREKYGGYFADIDGIFLHDSVAPNRVSEI